MSEIVERHRFAFVGCWAATGVSPVQPRCQHPCPWGRLGRRTTRLRSRMGVGEGLDGDEHAHLEAVDVVDEVDGPVDTAGTVDHRERSSSV